MELAQMEITQTQIRTHTPRNSPLIRALARAFTRTSTLAAARLKAFWRSGIWRSSIWTSLVRRAGSKRKTLTVRETAALGDRRFVCVIQFERQRFLIGSSPSSVTLLSQLPDESAGAEVTAEVNGEKNREHSREESRGKN
ncbi:MAG: flagellar biosynthetic protein FliO [Terriglobales bacterium]